MNKQYRSHMEMLSAVLIFLFSVLTLHAFSSSPEKGRAHADTQPLEQQLQSLNDALAPNTLEAVHNFTQYLKQNESRYVYPSILRFLDDYAVPPKEDVFQKLKNKRNDIFHYIESYNRLYADKDGKLPPSPIVPYDVRSLPAVYQLYTLSQGIYEGGASLSRNRRSVPSFIDLFPVDGVLDAADSRRPEDALEFLKDYVYFARPYKRPEALRLLAEVLSPVQKEEFTSGLRYFRRNKYADYLEECSSEPPTSYSRRVRRNNEVFFALPLMDARDYIDDLDVAGHQFKNAIEKNYDKTIKDFQRELETTGNPGFLFALTQMLESSDITRRLLAMDILARNTSVNDRVFINILERNDRHDWEKVSALQILADRGTPLPKGKLSKCLKHANPFIRFYALFWTQHKHKKYLEKMARHIVALYPKGSDAPRAGEENIYVRHFLTRYYHIFGYASYKKLLAQIDIEKLPPLCRLDLIVNAFRHQDAPAVTPYFNPHVRHYLFIPAAYALYQLEKTKTLNTLYRFFDEPLQSFPQDSTGGNREKVEVLFTLIADAGEPRGLELLYRLYAENMWPFLCKDALVCYIPHMTPAQLEHLEKTVGGSYLVASYMCRKYNPEYLPYLSRFYNKAGSEISFYHAHEADTMPLQSFWRNHLSKIIKEAKYENPNLALGNAFLVDNETARSRFVGDLTHLSPENAVEELIWCSHNGDEPTSVYALRYLLMYPQFKKQIDPLMSVMLESHRTRCRFPAIVWFARQGKHDVLEEIDQSIYDLIICRQIIVHYVLEHLPGPETVKLLAQLVKDRHYDVWDGIDVLLKQNARKDPQLLLSYLDCGDREMVKKVLTAVKGVLPDEAVSAIEVYLKQEDTILAVHAFEAMQDRWSPRHLPLLKDLYQRVLSVSIKRDIMAVIASFDSRAAGDTLRQLAQQEDITGDYVQFYTYLRDPVSFQDKRETQSNLYLALQRLCHLRSTGNIQYVDLLMDHLIDFPSHRDRFMERISSHLRKNKGE